MAAGEIPITLLYEDDFLFVINDIRPKAKTHLLVISKQHIPSLNEVTTADAPLLGHMMTSLHTIAKAQGLSSFRTIVNSGQGSGQEIFHLHFHLLGGTQLPGF
jgi:histidine triad (HIT) family protein